MTAQWTNQETGKSMTVYVHAAYLVDGEEFLKVNKGTLKTATVFGVRKRDTDLTSLVAVIA